MGDSNKDDLIRVLESLDRIAGLVAMLAEVSADQAYVILQLSRRVEELEK